MSSDFRRASTAKVLCLFAGVLLSAVRAPGSTVEKEFVLGASGARLHMAVAAGRLSTVSIENLITRESTPVRGIEFELHTANGLNLTDRDFALMGVSDLLLAGSEGRPSGRRTVFRMESKPASIRVDIVVEARDGENWIERYLQVWGPRATVLNRVSLTKWDVAEASGPSLLGPVVETLGYPSGAGQPVFVRDLFLGIAHPGAENLVKPGRISLGIPAYAGLDPERPVRSERMIIGAAAAGERRRAFLRYIHSVRRTPLRMIDLVNDWYWKDKSKTLDALKRLADIRKATGVPIDSFTLDDGWSSYTDIRNGIWGALNEERLPEGWEALRDTARSGGMNVSLWFGPIGGYGYRKLRIPLGKRLGYETYEDKFCLAGDRYGADVRETFSRWARLGMDFIKVDGFWPACPEKGHGHPTGAGAAIAQMDALIYVFAKWRQARPDLAIAYTSGSNPSPFWLLHCDYVWRAGVDDQHAGTGAPFDRYNNFIDACLQGQRETGMPASSFVTFDLVAPRILPADDDTLKRGFWWAAARTSLHHDWYLSPDDLTDAQWRALAEAARWAKSHEREFRFSRMIGGDVRHGEVYGFACFDGHTGTVALRNPARTSKQLQGTLRDWLDLAPAEEKSSFRLVPVFEQNSALDGSHQCGEDLRIELPGYGIVVYELSIQ